MAKLKVQVLRGHRFEQVPLRTIDGGKLYVTKDDWTYVDTATELAQGEEWTIRRLAEEGRLLLKTWRGKRPEPEPEAAPEAESEPDPEPTPEPEPAE